MTSRLDCSLASGAMVAAAVMLSVSSAAAQERPGPALEFAAGWTGFADDGIVGESLVGGAGRFYMGPRLAIGPEIIYIRGERHSHLMLTGNVTFDVLSPENGRPPKVTGSFTAGGGVRVSLNDRLFVAGDVRIGWETHIRISGALGVRLGR